MISKDFFEEAQEKASVHPGEPFTTFRHDDLQIWCGDFFDFDCHNVPFDGFVVYRIPVSTTLVLIVSDDLTIIV